MWEKIGLSAGLLAVLAVPTWPAQPAAAPATLRQCYDWALARSEALKIQQEAIEQSGARARATLGGVFPQLDWELTDLWQDPRGVRKLESKGFSGFVQKEQVESKFSLKQPLFSGFKEFSALSGFRKEGARDALRLQAASRALYETTAGAFYAALAQEMARDNTSAALESAQDRVKELTGFLRLGKARESEVFTAQAHAAALKAALRQTQARIGSAREELSFLTGQDLSLAPLRDELADRPPFGTLEDAVARAGQRADIKAQKEDLAANEMRVRYEKGSYWPSLDLLGKYYTKRATFIRDIDWDVTLSLQVPLFRGGTTSANVRRALSAYRQSRLALEELERHVLHFVRKTYGELSSAVEEAQAQEEAAQAAQKSYDSLLEEYRLGLVTNLDVLQALDLLQSLKNARDAARLKAKILFLRLGVATETLP